ncbi:hypothetical protein BTVI_15449 [Pitangus sulphuratus]|nr:hypothetical protein BTVI_15449 [Pitangus sulphuratus]
MEFCLGMDEKKTESLWVNIKGIDEKMSSLVRIKGREMGELVTWNMQKSEVLDDSSASIFTATPFEHVKLDPPACITKLCHARQLAGTDLAQNCEMSDLRQKSNTGDSSWVTGGKECIGSDVRKPYNALKWQEDNTGTESKGGEAEECNIFPSLLVGPKAYADECILST